MTIVIGFDSAWSSKPSAKGGICGFEIANGSTKLVLEPENVGWERASEIVSEFTHNNRTIVFIDQPTIVPNETGSRPVERMAASVVSFIGGGVQPSNRGKSDMFGDDAQIWKFLHKVSGNLNPGSIMHPGINCSLIEVFPALALPSLNPEFFGRYKAPKYNPSNRKKFQIEDWKAVCNSAQVISDGLRLTGLKHFISQLKDLDKPKKYDQDKLDAILCALIGLNWLLDGDIPTYQLGSLETGLMIGPCSNDVLKRLNSSKHNVPGFISRV